MTEARVIKKYSNRRMYDTGSSRYVNLEAVAALVREGLEIEVVDADSGEDLTRHVLTQIIVEDSRNPEGGPPVDFLRDLIRTTDSAHRDFLRWYLGGAAEAYKKVQKTWRQQTRWPSAEAQRDFWRRAWDPFGVSQKGGVAKRQATPESDGAPDQTEPPEEVSELKELRLRLEELEKRMS